MKAMVTSWMLGLLLLLNFALPQSGRAQDTLVWRFSGQSLSMQEQLKILEQAYKEQFKNYPMQMDSLLRQSSVKLKHLIADTSMMRTLQQGLQMATHTAHAMLSDTALWNQQKRLLNSMFTDTALWNQQRQLMKQLLTQSSSLFNAQTVQPNGPSNPVAISPTLTLRLQGDSKTTELEVKVEKAVSVLTLTLKGELESGRIKLEIIDPDGKLQGGYTMEGNGRGRKELVSGVSVKQYPSPEIGAWTVKVVSNKAVGSVALISNQKL